MSETKSYKNINLSDLGTRQKITQVASRVALFVPRLLGKLATKLIVNPITKLTTGQTYEQVRNAAVDITMEVQKEKSAELSEKIEEGHKNLDAWQNDTEYYIGNLGKYKSYQSTIEDLEKKRTRLLTSPKKLLVAKHYRYVMGAFIAKHKEEKQTQKMVKQVVAEYLAKKAEIESKRKEILALEGALNAAGGELTNMEAALTGFKTENAEIVDQITEEDYLDAEIEPVVEQPLENDELTEQELDSVFAGVEGVVTPNEETKVEEVAVEPVVEQPVVPEMPNAGFRAPEARDLGQDAPVDPVLLAQMAQMAAMPQAPASDAQALESYGLSEGENQKHL